VPRNLSLLLKTGILLMHLMLMMYPMIMISGPVLTHTNGDDTMGDAGMVFMKTELCPMGGRDNIQRFEKSDVGKITYAGGGKARDIDSGGAAHVQVSFDGRDLLACTTWFHQSQGLPTHLYQSHLYRAHLYQTSFLPSSKNGRTQPGKLALTGDPLAGAITHYFCLRQKSFRLFFYCSRTRGRFKVWYR
jgi:hypothetical protein